MENWESLYLQLETEMEYLIAEKDELYEENVSLRNEVESLGEDNENLKGEKSDLENKIDDLQDEVEDLIVAIDRLEIESDNKSVLIDELTETNGQLEKNLETATEELDDMITGTGITKSHILWLIARTLNMEEQFVPNEMVDAVIKELTVSRLEEVFEQIIEEAINKVELDDIQPIYTLEVSEKDDALTLYKGEKANLSTPSVPMDKKWFPIIWDNSDKISVVGKNRISFDRDVLRYISM